MDEALFAIECPSCSVELELEGMPAAWRGSDLECPGCGAAISLTDGILPERTPCPGCGRETAPDDVLCVSCGTDFRSGKRLKTYATKLVPDGFQPPADRAPPPREDRTLRRWLVYAGAAAASFVVLGCVVSNCSREPHRVAEPQPAATLAKPPPAPAPEVLPPPEPPPHTGYWHRVCGVLDCLQEDCGDRDALRELREHAARAPEGADAAVGLMTVYALARLAQMDRAGARGCRHIASGHPGSRYARLVDEKGFREACRHCGGRKSVSRECEGCRGGGKCPRCGGKGKVEVTAGRSKRKAVLRGEGLERPDRDVRRIRGPGGQGGGPVTKTLACGHCGGKGKCRACGGKRRLASACPACRGSGTTFSAAKARSRLRDALKWARDDAGKAARGRPGGEGAGGAWRAFLALFGDGKADGAGWDSSRVNLFDAALLYSRRAGVPLSIDPAALGRMAEASVATNEAPLIADEESLSGVLRRHGLELRRADLPPDGDTAVVTTRAAWSYGLACRELRKGRAREAARILEAVRDDGSDFAAQCRRMRETLGVVLRNAEDIPRMAKRVRGALEGFVSGRDQSEFFAVAAELALKKENERRINEPAAGAAVGRAETAADRMLEAAEAWTAFRRRMGADVEAVYARVEEAYGRRLCTEAAFLLGACLANFEALQEVSAEIRKAGLDFAGRREDAPAGIAALSARLSERVAAAAGCARPAAGGGADAALDGYRRGLAMDAANLAARVGAGRAVVREHLSTLRGTVLASPADADSLAGLAGEFRGKRKGASLAALGELLGEGSPPERAGPPPRMASSCGLAVMVHEGALYPVSVAVQPRREVAVSRTREAGEALDAGSWGYWGFYRERIEVRMMGREVVFGDYGEKDVFMVMSAFEVLKWLKRRWPGKMDGQAIRVDFHDLTGGKGGDSAGCAMAVAAYSRLEGRPVRRDVAMTGAIRADGAVVAVGGVAEKVAGACAADGVEVVVAPMANEADLLLVPASQLCRLMIVTADDIGDYLDIATDPGHMSDAFEEARRGQMLALAGRAGEAREVLLPVARRHPRLYSAGRLCELIALHGMLGND